MSRGDLLSLPTESLQRHLEGHDTVISCLGHTMSVRGILGPAPGLLPPARDNQRAAELFALRIGARHPEIEWVAVRPDTLCHDGTWKRWKGQMPVVVNANTT